EDGSGMVFINNSAITGNTCVQQGGGIGLDSNFSSTESQTANLTVTESVISGNSALGPDTVGGGIGGVGPRSLTIQASAQANNFVNGKGGGSGAEGPPGSLPVIDSTFVGNDALGGGGGIFANSPSTTIDDSTITGNIAQTVGAGNTPPALG